MNNAASMNLLSANRWSPRPAAAFLLPERPSVVTRNRIFLRFYLCAESFHANTRSRSMRACKTEEEEGQASRRSDPRRKNSFLVNEIRFQWPPPVPPSRATFPFRYEAKKVRGMCLSWNVLFHKYFWSFSANFTRIVHAIYFERRMQLEINSFLEIISFREIWRLELCINY